MSAPIITAEKAIAMVGVLPTLHPRPNGTNLNKLERDLVGKLSTTPSFQSMEEGYGGMVEDVLIYALRCATPWVPRTDPGPHRTINPENNTAGQADELVQYNFKKGVYDSQENVKAAVIAALNLSVPDAYKKVGGAGVGVRMYRTMDDPKEIIKGLRRLYGRLSPNERAAMDTKWSSPWNTASPVEHYFKGLEEMYILATKYPPEFTMAQMVQRAKTAMETCGLFQTHLNEWNVFPAANQDWGNMKAHFGEAYENLLISGRGIAIPGTIANVQELTDEEDDDMTQITDVMSTFQMAANAQAQSVTDGINAMRQEMATLRAEVQAGRQALANNAAAISQKPPVAQYFPAPAEPQMNWAPIAAPTPIAAFAAIPAPAPQSGPPGFPNFLAPPLAPQQQQQRRQGGGGRGRGRQGGAGRGRGPSRKSLAFGQHPPNSNAGQQMPQAGGQVQQAGSHGGTTPYKYYNNWNMCMSCGWDVPAWHTSKTCPPACRKANHHEGCDRANYAQFQSAGYSVSMRRAGKTLLPSNPGPQQA
jgi:hypothetical protein